MRARAAVPKDDAVRRRQARCAAPRSDARRAQKRDNDAQRKCRARGGEEDAQENGLPLREKQVLPRFAFVII